MCLSRRNFITGLLAGSSVSFLSSCHQNNRSGNGTVQGTIAVLFDGLYSPFWVASHNAIVAKLKNQGFAVAEAISDQDDSKQLGQVRAMIARGVQGMIIVHTDSNAVIPAIRAANKSPHPYGSFQSGSSPKRCLFGGRAGRQ